MVINTNTPAQATANNLNASHVRLSKSLARLSSGSKIVEPADDAAGLAVSSRFSAIIKRLDAASTNVANAASFTQTQDGFLQNVEKALRRMSELSMLAIDNTKPNEDRALYNREFRELKEYISHTARQDFNGISLFSGKELDVTKDEDGSKFAMAGIKLNEGPYDNVINSGTDSWTLTQDAWRTSTDLFKLNEDAWLTSTAGYVTNQDLWELPNGQQDTITITAGDHAGDTFTVTANGQTTAPIASVPPVAKVSQVVIHNASSGAAPGATYSVTFTGGPTITVTEGIDFNSSGGNDTAIIRDALIAKINADPNSPATAAASPDWSTPNDALRLTAKVPGNDFYANLSSNDPNGGSVICHPLTWNVDGNALTAAAINTAVNGLSGVASTLSGNVITIASDTPGTALNGSTSVTLANTDGGNAPTPTIETATYTTIDPGGGAAKLEKGTFLKEQPLVQGAPSASTQVEAGTFVSINPGSEDPQATAHTNGSFVKADSLGSNATAVAAGTVTALATGSVVATDPTSVDSQAVALKAGEIVSSSQDLSSIATKNSDDYKDVNLKSEDGATVALSLVQSAINQLASDRAVLGAGLSRLDFTKNQLAVKKENLSEAISRITDTDFAQESTRYAQYQILVQSGAEMLKQANQLPQAAVELLM